jgi:hypothetical protein
MFPVNQSAVKVQTSVICVGGGAAVGAGLSFAEGEKRIHVRVGGAGAAG